MSFSEYFPIWNKLTPQQQQRLSDAASLRSVKAGTVLHSSGSDCIGLLVLRSGMLRAYSISPEGREVTLYRLFERDICLLSASCMLSSIQFEIIIEAEKDCEMWVIPPDLYKELMNESAAVANYTNDLLSSHFSDVMWMVEQIMWKSVDRRLAAFLTEESRLEDSTQLKITHEKIANHMGTAREVVTRMLKHFQQEGLVKLTRGGIEITDPEGLEDLSE